MSTTANDPTNAAAEYIGDGAYCAINQYGDLVLTTENGVSVQNIVVIEPELYPVLERFVAQAREQKIGRWGK
jgi:hypothetical protein